ncbi:MAG: hypothetical protein ACQESL_06000, partial [Bacteroidota bacterium]
MKSCLIVFLVSFVFLFPVPLTLAQNSSLQPDIDQADTVSAGQVIEALAHQHQVEFFYEPAWLEGIAVKPETARLSLSDALDVIAAEANLEVVTPEDDMVVLLPADGHHAEQKPEQEERMIGGDPGKNGRYSTATVY